jgi:hypothetical protein
MPSFRRRGQPRKPIRGENQTATKFGLPSATLQKMHDYFGAGREDSPTQKFHCKD